MSRQSPVRTAEFITTTGVGALALTGDVETGMRSFAAALADGDAIRFYVELVDEFGRATGAWEVAEGIYAAGTLTRARLIASSTGAALDLPAGRKRVAATDIPLQREFGGSFESPLKNSEFLLRYLTPAPLIIAANLADWGIAIAGDNPVSPLVITVADNGAPIGTITISAAGAITRATTGGAAQAVAAGHVITYQLAADAAAAAPGTVLIITGKGAY